LVLAVVAVVALVTAACGGDSSDGAAPSTTAAASGSTADDGGTQDDTTSTDDSDDTGSTDDGTGDEADDGGSADPGAGGDLSLVPEGATDIIGNPAGQGFVELGGVRYDFILTGACQKIFGAVQAAGPLADGSDGSADSIIPPENWESDVAAEWEPPYVHIDIGDASWRSEAGSEHFIGGENMQLTAEQSSVTAFTNNGSVAKGTAVFYNSFNFEEIETASGSFEFYCP
jgi:hypothetical protein